ncbi:MAG: dienelactone hydrolase family protein [Clostridiales Family XIII bacterium]|jgi:predicted peptidase|nr:dienelactone hydrolase family protein [Clostridiales Family XIII bacterium]
MRRLRGKQERWLKRSCVILITAALVGVLIWTYCVQPSLSRAFDKASRKEIHAMTIGGVPFGMPYRIYAPRDAGEGRSYPVFLWLCGSGQCGTENVKQARYDLGIVDTLIEKQADNDYRCIIVAPQIPSESLATNGELLAGYMALVEKVQRQYHADTARLYVAGFSMGGDEIWELLERYPERIAAAVPICGGIGDPDAAEKFKDVPVWAFHGRLDLAYPVKTARAMVNALTAAGGNVRYTEYAFAGHVCWHLAYEEPELLPWIFSQTRHETETGSGYI